MSARYYAKQAAERRRATRGRLSFAEQARELLLSLDPGRSSTFVGGVLVTRRTKYEDGQHVNAYEIGNGGRRLDFEAAVVELARVAETLRGDEINGWLARHGYLDTRKATARAALAPS